MTENQGQTLNDPYRTPALLANCSTLIREFDPSDTKYSASHFFRNIDYVARLANWRDTDKLLLARSKMRSSAANFLHLSHELQTTENYETFKSAVLERFEAEEPLAVRMSALANCYQRERESVKEFADRITDTAHRYLREQPDDHPQVKANNEKTKIAQFLHGLNPDLKRFVLGSDFENFSSAVKTAVKHEQIAKMSFAPAPIAAATKMPPNTAPGDSNGYAASVPFNPELEAYKSMFHKLNEKALETDALIRDLADEVRALKLQRAQPETNVQPRVPPRNLQPARSSDANGVRCWTCGNFGHFSRNCQRHQQEHSQYRYAPRRNGRNYNEAPDTSSYRNASKETYPKRHLN